LECKDTKKEAKKQFANLIYKFTFSIVLFFLLSFVVNTKRGVKIWEFQSMRFMMKSFD